MNLPSVGALLFGTVRLSASGPVDVTTAWERYERYALWPTWSPQLRRVETPLDRLTPGSTGRVVGPLGVSAAFEVADVDAVARRWSWIVRRAGVTVALVHGIDAGSDGQGSVAWLIVSGPRPIVLGYAPVAWYALHRLTSS